MNASNDLPVTMGQVAPRSLKESGINNLYDASNYTEKELLSIHGVGPKAIRMLKEALAAKQLGLKQD